VLLARTGLSDENSDGKMAQQLRHTQNKFLLDLARKNAFASEEVVVTVSRGGWNLNRGISPERFIANTIEIFTEEAGAESGHNHNYSAALIFPRERNDVRGSLAACI
jgi:hypothetical protein